MFAYIDYFLAQVALMLIITISTPGLVTPENTLGSMFAVFCYCVFN